MRYLEIPLPIFTIYCLVSSMPFVLQGIPFVQKSPFLRRRGLYCSAEKEVTSSMKETNAKPKKKPLYSMASDVGFLLKMAWKAVPGLYFWHAVYILLELGAPAIAMILPSRVIALLQSGAGFSTMLPEIVGWSLGLLVCGAGCAGLDRFMGFAYLTFPRMKMCQMGSLKAVTTDYPNGEVQAFLDLRAKTGNYLTNNSAGSEEGYRVMRRLLIGFIGLLFFGAVLWGYSPIAVLGVAALTSLGFLSRWAANQWEFKNRDNWAPFDRKMNYIHEEAGNYRFAKDVRLFGMASWLSDLYDSFQRLRLHWADKAGKAAFLADAADCLLGFLREGAAYGFLLWSAVAGEIDPAAFVLYFSAVGNFSSQFLACLTEFSALHRVHLETADYRALLDYPDHFQRESGRPLPKADQWELTLQNVSFRYPGAEKDTIHNMSLTLRAGEKTALVGLNGAGKSTLVKLLCGLYDPTEGQVLLNGIPVKEFDREEYYTLFSPVFQESDVRAYSVARNVSMDKVPDMEKVERCLKLSGLWGKVESLPQGVKTKLMKYIWHDGVDLSGGEAQKLMLARALYKGAPIILLDEPTAALDPIAEAELYEKYGGLTAGKTSLYISHRLSSTRFCDRVLFLENGKIVEEGTHEALLEQHGRYYELYELQSAYYKKNVKMEQGGEANETALA